MRWVILFFVALFMGGFWSSGAFAGYPDCTPIRTADGKIKRSSYQVTLFRKDNACPATGMTAGRCPGYIVDHAWPLCACGADTPRNMQWQTKQAAAAKDVWERKICRGEVD